MKQANPKDFFSLLSTNANQFPFVYSPDYADFLQQEEKKETLIFFDDKKNSIACKVVRLKFIKALQVMYPPLDTHAKRLTAEQEGYFLNKFIRYIAKTRTYQRISQPENFAIFQVTPNNTISAPFGTYFLDLAGKTEEQLFAGLHVKHRNVIRNAQKKGVSVVFGPETLKDFYELYKETIHRSNLYCEPYSYFEHLLNSMPNNVLCGVAYAEGAPQGGVFMPFTSFACFYTHGASANRITVNGAVNLLHWEAILKMKREGVKRYDMVGARLTDVSGTRLEGIQQFKSRFGAELETGFIWKKNIDRLESLVFDLASYSKQLLNGYTPVKDMIDEELKKRYAEESKSGETLRHKLAKKKQKLIRSIRVLKGPINKKQLISDLQNVGINAGDTILIHSSLSKLGNIKGGAHTVIESFIEQVGAKGNIAFPTYSYNNTMHDTIRDKDFIFDPLTSPSIVGKISEQFRKLPGAKRSLHPTHSVTALGPDADLIVSGHLDAPTNFGPGTPFHRIRELKGKIVGIGIPLGPVTIYHSIEDFYPGYFKGVYLPRQAGLKMLVDGKVIVKKISVHNPIQHRTRIDKDREIESWWHTHLANKGILHEGKFGEGNIWWMNVQELFDEMYSLMEKGITIYKVPHVYEEA